MTDFSVRVLAEAEWRDAASMFRGAMHCPPPSDEEWAASKQSIEPGRYLGAVTEGRVLGTTFAFTSAVAVPGGAVLPMAAVTRVGVRADHTRRGMLTDLMRAQLADATARGEVFAGLIASEPGIYGRFGFGIGTRHRTLHIRGGRVGPEVPAAGQIRIVTGDEAVELLPQLYRRIGLSRPGMISRPSHWWAAFAARSIRTAEPNVVAVHSGPDGDDGFVTYQSKAGDHHRATMDVGQLFGATPGVINDLWRFVLSVDLVDEVRAPGRPVDDPLDALLVDFRTCATQGIEDHLWLRLVDVPAALAARTYGQADPIVIDVVDRFLPENSGTYVVSEQGAERGSGPAGLAMDVDLLAMTYLGGTPPSVLADVGRIQVYDATAVARADRLFGTGTVPWCGTWF